MLTPDYGIGEAGFRGSVITPLPYYEHKMKGFMDLLGLPELSLKVEDVTEQAIVERFEYLEQNYERVQNSLDERIPELQALSRRTTEIISDGIRKDT